MLRGARAGLASGQATGLYARLPEGWRRLRRPAAIKGPGTIAVFRRRLRDFADGRYEKLLSHFGEAGTTVLVIKHVEYDGHDRTPS